MASTIGHSAAGWAGMWAAGQQRANLPDDVSQWGNAVTRPLRRLAPVALSLALVAGTAAACARGSDPQPVTAGAAPGLPTLPPIRQRAPQRFDADGCSQPSADGRSCASSADQIDAASAAEAPDGTRTLAGFVGRYWSTQPTGALAVLETTVTASASPEGRWRAVGLVRNESAEPVGAVAVHAELVGQDGKLIEAVTGDSLVGSLRSGEPVPFAIAASSAEPSQVVSVRWSAAPAPSGAGASRMLELKTFWTRAAGDQHRLDTPMFTDAPGQPLPLVVYGSVVNQGSGTIASPVVVVAWLDGGGRVVAVRKVAGTNNTGTVSGLEPQGAADFLVSVDAAEASVIPPDQQAIPMMWGTGS